ncbi:MAG: nucleotidyltransferase domain-containing protein [Bacteroidetes bacterium]|nr:nucleotidyltransferase domain-containing protein [Bacteroidota bacterium]
MPDIKRHILAALAYFDLFNYPLTMDEIYFFLPAKHPFEDLENALHCLAAERYIYKFDRFYSLKNDRFLVERREKGNAKAAEMMIAAKKVGDLLIRFPYVRGIAISGSLSKNFADEDSDIDLFIITAKNRLWIARTLMHCFKKLTFLVNKEHYFCMNYYIDEDDLSIHEKNVYTATEIATLIPLHGDAVFEQFYTANAWSRNFLPNKCLRLATARPEKHSPLKRFIEILFNNPIGNTIDNLLMKLTSKRWMKKMRQGKKNNRGIIMAMDAGKHYAKPDPFNFQFKLISSYQNRVDHLLERSEGIAAH